MKYLLSGLAVGWLLAGCTGNEPSVARQLMLDRLDAIEKSVDRLEATVSGTPLPASAAEPAEAQPHPPEVSLLAKIPPLPPRPSDRDIRNYITAIRRPPTGTITPRGNSRRIIIAKSARVTSRWC